MLHVQSIFGGLWYIHWFIENQWLQQGISSWSLFLRGESVQSKAIPEVQMHASPKLAVQWSLVDFQMFLNPSSHGADQFQNLLRNYYAGIRDFGIIFNFEDSSKIVKVMEPYISMTVENLGQGIWHWKLETGPCMTSFMFPRATVRLMFHKLSPPRAKSCSISWDPVFSPPFLRERSLITILGEKPGPSRFLGHWAKSPVMMLCTFSFETEFWYFISRQSLYTNMHTSWNSLALSNPIFLRTSV